MVACRRRNVLPSARRGCRAAPVRRSRAASGKTTAARDRRSVRDSGTARAVAGSAAPGFGTPRESHGKARAPASRFRIGGAVCRMAGQKIEPVAGERGARPAARQSESRPRPIAIALPTRAGRAAIRRDNRGSRRSARRRCGQTGRPRKPAEENRSNNRTRRRSVVLAGQCGGSAASAATVSSRGKGGIASPSGASSRAPRIRRSAAARRNGRRAGLPTAFNKFCTRLVMNAVFPDRLSPVTATRRVRSRTSAVSIGS